MTVGSHNASTSAYSRYTTPSSLSTRRHTPTSYSSGAYARIARGHEREGGNGRMESTTGRAYETANRYTRPSDFGTAGPSTTLGFDIGRTERAADRVADRLLKEHRDRERQYHHNVTAEHRQRQGDDVTQHCAQARDYRSHRTVIEPLYMPTTARALPPSVASSSPPRTAAKRDSRHRFEILRKLGSGTYGKVSLAYDHKLQKEVAVKLIKKSAVENKQDLVRIKREIRIMSALKHPHIIEIYEVFENKDKIIIILEYASGGELYDYVSAKGCLSEAEARRIFREIGSATLYCHRHNVAHRDLKLENILLDKEGKAKIADFGLSNYFALDDQNLLATFCGSPLYASPEIINGSPYRGPEVDCWSLGVLLYTLVYGSMPFDGRDFNRMIRQIKKGAYYEPDAPSTASVLVRSMLRVNAERRADIEEIVTHWWLNLDDDAVSIPDLPENQVTDHTPLHERVETMVVQDLEEETDVFMEFGHLSAATRTRIEEFRRRREDAEQALQEIASPGMKRRKEVLPNLNDLDDVQVQKEVDQERAEKRAVKEAEKARHNDEPQAPKRASLFASEVATKTETAYDDPMERLRRLENSLQGLPEDSRPSTSAAARRSKVDPADGRSKVDPADGGLPPVEVIGGEGRRRETEKMAVDSLNMLMNDLLEQSEKGRLSRALIDRIKDHPKYSTTAFVRELLDALLVGETALSQSPKPAAVEAHEVHASPSKESQVPSEPRCHSALIAEPSFEGSEEMEQQEVQKSRQSTTLIRSNTKQGSRHTLLMSQHSRLATESKPDMRLWRHVSIEVVGSEDGSEAFDSSFDDSELEKEVDEVFEAPTKGASDDDESFVSARDANSEEAAHPPDPTSPSLDRPALPSHSINTLTRRLSSGKYSQSTDKAIYRPGIHGRGPNDEDGNMSLDRRTKVFIDPDDVPVLFEKAKAYIQQYPTVGDSPPRIRSPSHFAAELDAKMNWLRTKDPDMGSSHEISASPRPEHPSAVDAEPVLEATVDAVPVSEATVDAVHFSEAAVDAVHVSEAAVDAVNVSEAAVDAVNVSEAAVDAVNVSEATVDVVPMSETVVNVTTVSVGDDGQASDEVSIADSRKKVTAQMSTTSTEGESKWSVVSSNEKSASPVRVLSGHQHLATYDSIDDDNYYESSMKCQSEPPADNLSLSFTTPVMPPIDEAQSPPRVVGDEATITASDKLAPRQTSPSIVTVDDGPTTIVLPSAADAVVFNAQPTLTIPEADDAQVKPVLVSVNGTAGERSRLAAKRMRNRTTALGTTYDGLLEANDLLHARDTEVSYLSDGESAQAPRISAATLAAVDLDDDRPLDGRRLGVVDDVDVRRASYCNAIDKTSTPASSVSGDAFYATHSPSHVTTGKPPRTPRGETTGGIFNFVRPRYNDDTYRTTYLDYSREGAVRKALQCEGERRRSTLTETDTTTPYHVTMRERRTPTRTHATSVYSHGDKYDSSARFRSRSRPTVGRGFVGDHPLIDGLQTQSPYRHSSPPDHVAHLLGTTAALTASLSGGSSTGSGEGYYKSKYEPTNVSYRRGYYDVMDASSNSVPSPAVDRESPSRASSMFGGARRAIRNAFNRSTDEPTGNFGASSSVANRASSLTTSADSKEGSPSRFRPSRFMAKLKEHLSSEKLHELKEEEECRPLSVRGSSLKSSPYTPLVSYAPPVERKKRSVLDTSRRKTLDIGYDCGERQRASDRLAAARRERIEYMRPTSPMQRFKGFFKRSKENLHDAAKSSISSQGGSSLSSKYSGTSSSYQPPSYNGYPKSSHSPRKAYYMNRARHNWYDEESPHYS